jgi:hypothetical protein
VASLLLLFGAVTTSFQLRDLGSDSGTVLMLLPGSGNTKLAPQNTLLLPSPAGCSDCCCC